MGVHKRADGSAPRLRSALIRCGVSALLAADTRSFILRFRSRSGAMYMRRVVRALVVVVACGFALTSAAMLVPFLLSWVAPPAVTLLSPILDRQPELPADAREL